MFAFPTELAPEESALNKKYVFCLHAGCFTGLWDTKVEGFSLARRDSRISLKETGKELGSRKQGNHVFSRQLCLPC